MNRRFDLVAFDVDGTLIRHPEGKTVWEVLNRRYIGDDTVNEERYRRVLEGTLSYADWVTLDVQGWYDAGATRNGMLEAMKPLAPVDGIPETVAALRATGARVVVISGTLDLLLDARLAGVPFDEVYTNKIGFAEDGTISGWTATPFDMDGKAVALRSVALRESIPLERCAFVGDSSNDVAVAQIAGHTVAFNPRSEALIEVSDAVVRGDDLQDVLPHLLPE
jgi:HAD superfamily phosphoserine phosphatase-like hydrolase